MRSTEDKGCLNNFSSEENPGGSFMNLEFQKSGVMNRPSHHHRTPLGKPTPSKWDDAQKWLVNLSRGDKNQAKASPRNSNADDRRLIAPVPKKEYENEGENGSRVSIGANQCVVETKNVDCDESIWRSNKPVYSSKSVVRSICLRDVGTEMTPIASQEPSRAATPVKATSPASSGSSTPVVLTTGRNVSSPTEKTGDAGGRGGEETDGMAEIKSDAQSRKLNPLEARALAWEEAERAKYMSRYKREDVKIQAWENHQKMKAEMKNRKVEMKAERLRSRAKEKYNSRIAATRRLAEEKRGNEKAMKTCERADYKRRSGHVPSCFSFKLPSCCR